MAATLEGGPLNLAAIREFERSDLVEILEMNDGSKHLVLDTHLSSLLTHILTSEAQKVGDEGLAQV